VQNGLQRVLNDLKKSVSDFFGEFTDWKQLSESDFMEDATQNSIGYSFRKDDRNKALSEVFQKWMAHLNQNVTNLECRFRYANARKYLRKGKQILKLFLLFVVCHQLRFETIQAYLNIYV
jgi:hypothetical protein